MVDEQFYNIFLTIVISFFCGFLLGIERTRVSAQYGARDHIFFSMISTSLIILYEDFISDIGIVLLIVIYSGMVIFLLIGSIYRLFHEENPGYTTTLSMMLAMVLGIIVYYDFFIPISIATLFLIILSTKKQFYKIQELRKIEWTGTVQFIAIVVLLYILIPEGITILNIDLKAIIIIFITILAVKYFSYFLLKYSAENNLYYISILGGFAHSEATTVQLAKIGASPSAIWLVIQTMLGRMILILVLGAPNLLYYALLPILSTIAVGLFGSFIILKGKATLLETEKIRNPLSLKSAIIFALTYALALLISFILDFLLFENYLAYCLISFLIGLFSGGASSLFVTTSYLSGLVNIGQALLMLTIGLTAAILNKIFYSIRFLSEGKNKKKYAFNLITYQIITILILVSLTLFTINIFTLPFFSNS
ncbi:MAG: DUF4010 domain-containing protein [Candidatus Lokiarchaeota archaeon]|nr:DUF4010 domain-containing protein [Candidatus Lokiarchaeota archaeon]MBD3202372.1 DUF4010 domain-containing protein [Candidatus Lokiarchaeota archaeon]